MILKCSLIFAGFFGGSLAFADFCPGTRFTEARTLSCAPNFPAPTGTVLRISVQEQVGCTAPIRYHLDYKTASIVYAATQGQFDRAFEGDFSGNEIMDAGPEARSTFVRNSPDEQYLEISYGLITGKAREGWLHEVADFQTLPPPRTEWTCRID